MRGLLPGERCLLQEMSVPGSDSWVTDREEEVLSRLVTQGRVRCWARPAALDEVDPGEDPRDVTVWTWTLTEAGRRALEVCG